MASFTRNRCHLEHIWKGCVVQSCPAGYLHEIPMSTNSAEAISPSEVKYSDNVGGSSMVSLKCTHLLHCMVGFSVLVSALAHIFVAKLGLSSIYT